MVGYLAANDRLKGAFDHVRWDGVLEHLRSIGYRGRMFRLFQSYLSDRYIRVVTGGVYSTERNGTERRGMMD